METNVSCPEKHKRSQEIVQALEAATTVLLQIQQGEVGTGYITPYFGGNIIPNPVGQPYIPPHGSAYGAPYPNHPLHGVPFGPPVGATFNNYASPYPNPVVVSHPNTYASPYSNSVNQHHANYASPYANSGAPNQATVNSPVRSSHNKADKPDGHEKIRDNKEAHAPHQDNVRVGIEVEKANDEIAGQGNSNKDEDTNKATGEADDQNVSNEKVEASRACDETTVPGVSNGKAEAHDVDMDANNVKGADEQDTINKEDEASNDDDLTDDDFMVAKGDNQNITPPAENHRLFTGERLGDFTSTENIDWLLTMSNGGKIPRPNKKARIDPPPRISPSQIDDQVQMEVSKIINQIMLCKYWRGHPGGTPKHLFYASAEGQQLAAELRRLMATAKPVVNTVVPLAESQARLRFYQHLESRAFREKRDHEIQGGFHRFYAPPVQMQRWAPAVGLPGAQYPTSGLLVPPILPSNAPMKVPFVPRGNVIAPPPGGRNIEEEKKAETYGYPPMPPQRPGHSQQGQKRKRTAKT